MRSIWLAVILLLLQIQSPSQTPAQRGLVLAQDNVLYPFPVGQGKMRWSGDRLAGCDFCAGGGPVLWAVDRQGNRKSVAFKIPGAGYIGVHDVAAGPDGSFSAVGLAISDDSRMSSFIAWIAPDMDRQVLIQTSPYSPHVITVAPDGSVWTMGEMLNDRHRLVIPNVLRHYSQSGQLLASTRVERVKMSGGGGYNVSGISTLMMSNDRIGWLTETCQYIEFSLDAVQMGSYGCPNGIKHIIEIAGVGLSTAGDLLVQPEWSTPLAPLQLDRATGAWKAVPVLKDARKTHMMLGFDGLTLVTSAATPQGASMRRYDWSDAAPGQ